MRFLLVCLLASGFAFAQNPPAARSTPTEKPAAAAPRADVLHLLEVLHTRPQMEAALHGMLAQVKRGQIAGFQESLRQKGVKLTPAQMEKAQETLDAIAEDMFKDMPYDEMMKATAEIYSQHFSPEDVKALLAFYEAPAGQKYLNQMPAILQESMQAGGEIMRARMPGIGRRADERMQKLVQDLSAPQSSIAPAAASPQRATPAPATPPKK